jgi:hypothetical protein
MNLDKYSIINFSEGFIGQIISIGKHDKRNVLAEGIN